MKWRLRVATRSRRLCRIRLFLRSPTRNRLGGKIVRDAENVPLQTEAPGASFTYESRWQRVRESNPVSTFRGIAQFCCKYVAKLSLFAKSQNRRFAVSVQNYAASVSEFVRKNLTDFQPPVA